MTNVITYTAWVFLSHAVGLISCYCKCPSHHSQNDRMISLALLPHYFHAYSRTLIRNHMMRIGQQDTKCLYPSDPLKRGTCCKSFGCTGFSLTPLNPGYISALLLIFYFNKDIHFFHQLWRNICFSLYDPPVNKRTSSKNPQKDFVGQ